MDRIDQVRALQAKLKITTPKEKLTLYPKKVESLALSGFQMTSAGLRFKSLITQQ